MTTSTDTLERQTLIEESRNRIEYERDRVRVYLPDLIKKLGITYGVPLIAAMLLATLGGIIISNFLPVSTTNIIVFGLNLGILLYGWRWLEKRTNATGIFLMYSRWSRTRRDLEKLLDDDASTIAQIDNQRAIMEAGAQEFIDTMRESGASPRKTS